MLSELARQAWCHHAFRAPICGSQPLERRSQKTICHSPDIGCAPSAAAAKRSHAGSVLCKGATPELGRSSQQPPMLFDHRPTHTPSCTCSVTAAFAPRLRAYSRLRSVLARHCCASRAATAADVSSRIYRTKIAPRPQTIGTRCHSWSATPPLRTMCHGQIDSLSGA